jgi:hypothetical protein
VFTDIITLRTKIGRDPSERPVRDVRPHPGEPGQHPAFLQRPSGAPPRAGAAVEDDDENYE